MVQNTGWLGLTNRLGRIGSRFVYGLLKMLAERRYGVRAILELSISPIFTLVPNILSFLYA